MARREEQLNVRVKSRPRYTDGGMCTNTTEALLSGEPQAAFITFVSASIHVATVSSTQSGTGTSPVPAANPPNDSESLVNRELSIYDVPRESKNHKTRTGLRSKFLVNKNRTIG